MMISDEFQKDLSAKANAMNAKAMSAYLKNQFVLLGIKSVERKELYPHYFAEWKRLNKIDQMKLGLELWQQKEREFHYVAVDWMRKAKLYKEPGAIEVFEKMICENSWWDTVDAIAVNLVGPYFLEFPDTRDEYIERWDSSENIWLNRTALIFQLKHKNKIDTDLLFYLIQNHKNSKEFFIRKAIGWALRELAKTQSGLVEDFIEKTPLSGLSRREALKHINK